MLPVLGCCVGIMPGRWARNLLPVPWRFSRALPAWQEADPAGAGSAGSALPGGGSESLCPQLQPAFGPASAGQMCTRRRGVTAVRGLCPCPAATCWRGAESPWGKLPQMPSPAAFPPLLLQLGVVWSPGTLVTAVLSPGLGVGTTAAHGDSDGAGPVW